MNDQIPNSCPKCGSREISSPNPEFDEDARQCVSCGWAGHVLQLVNEKAKAGTRSSRQGTPWERHQ